MEGQVVFTDYGYWSSCTRTAVQWRSSYKAIFLPHSSCLLCVDTPSLIAMQLRYANNSNYKNDEIITREVFLSSAVIDEFKKIVTDSEVGGKSDREHVG